MKKILALIMSISLVFAMTACGGMDTHEINIAALNGPTGIGMVQLMDDYNVEVYQSPTDVAAKVLNGDCDIAALPSNMAAVLYNKTKGQVVCIGTIALGNLYIMQNGKAKGDTILASGEGGTPEYVLKKVMPNAKVKWLASHADVVQEFLKTDGALAMLPEPFVTMAMAKGENVKVVTDLNEEWNNAVGTDLPMGVLVATKEFAEEHSKDIARFLEAYQKSVDFVNDAENSAQLVTEKGFFPDEKLAEKAIPGCKITLNTDEKILDSFYKELFKLNPKSIGGKLPDEEFYY